MTDREKVIKGLECCAHEEIGDCDNCPYDENTPHCDDCISREAAIEAIESLVCTMSVCMNTDEAHGMRRMKETAIDAIRAIPAITLKAQQAFSPDRDDEFENAICKQCKALEDDYMFLANGELHSMCPTCTHNPDKEV